MALAAGDGAAVVLAVGLALWTWSITAGFAFDRAFLATNVAWFAAVPLWVWLLAPTRGHGVALDPPRLVGMLARTAGMLLLAYLAFFFWAGGDVLPRLVALYVLWDASLLVLAWRLVAGWSLLRSRFARRVLIAGSGDPLDLALQLLEHPSFRNAELVAIATPDLTGAVPSVRVGPIETVDTLARDVGATDVLVAVQSDIDEKWVARLLRCQEAGANVIRLAQAYESALARVPVRHIEPTWLVTSFFDVAKFRESSPIVKRSLDVGAALVLLGAGLIVAPVIALMIVVDSGRPVFFRQLRIGRGGHPFTLLKFRTMTVNAEPDGVAMWSSPADPRITRVGRLLRRSRLDELPNLIAVLAGQMSMVGPRPERPQFVTELELKVPFYRARLLVLPGLTGWAQISHPYGDSIDDATAKLEYDLYYIKHQSLWFDLRILLRTAGTVLAFRGR